MRLVMRLPALALAALSIPTQRPASTTRQYHPQVNWTVVAGAPSPLTLDNLDELNALGNESVYLTTAGGIAQTPQPPWWDGITPDSDGRTGNGTGCAIIVVDHGYGEVDAFYFYFYA
ncbi:hypothetical protein N7454_010645 [Penicillium verhagenii]|nr:hypothetical protein N7454_010645 [Penicillium verhagenii]